MGYMATKKVPGGKLLRIKCDVTDGVLSGVSLTGDFFMHPEDGVIELESALNGMSSGAEVSEYVSKLNDVIHERGFELIGFSASDVAETLVEAVRGGSASGSGEAATGASGALDDMVKFAISGK